jgi:hypothetical protein
MDLMKASLMDLPAEKRARIFEQSSPLDVLLVGKDNASAETQRRGKEKKELLVDNLALKSQRLSFSASEKIWLKPKKRGKTRSNASDFTPKIWQRAIIGSFPANAR